MKRVFLHLPLLLLVVLTLFAQASWGQQAPRRWAHPFTARQQAQLQRRGFEVDERLVVQADDPQVRAALAAHWRRGWREAEQRLGPLLGAVAPPPGAAPTWVIVTGSGGTPRWRRVSDRSYLARIPLQQIDGTLVEQTAARAYLSGRGLDGRVPEEVLAALAAYSAAKTQHSAKLTERQLRDSLQLAPAFAATTQNKLPAELLAVLEGNAGRSAIDLATLLRSSRDREIPFEAWTDWLAGYAPAAASPAEPEPDSSDSPQDQDEAQDDAHSEPQQEARRWLELIVNLSGSGTTSPGRRGETLSGAQIARRLLPRHPWSRLDSTGRVVIGDSPDQFAELLPAELSAVWRRDLGDAGAAKENPRVTRVIDPSGRWRFRHGLPDDRTLWAWRGPDGQVEWQLK